MNLAVLVSGSGTLLQAMVDAGLPIEVVVADRPCRGIDIGRAAGIESVVIERSSFAADFDRAAYSARIVEVLQRRSVGLVAMAGFGTILDDVVFRAFPQRVVNTHPALLPSFPGWHAVGDALDFGVKVTGCTVHLATPKVDHGPILAQEAVTILESDDEASLHERIKTVERRLYVETLKGLLVRDSTLHAPANEPTTMEDP